MQLNELQKHWEELGKQDPLWAILSENDKKENKWDSTEFFKRGESQVGSILQQIESLGVPLPRGRALDFGCGVGRLTQALCSHFAACSGVDISSSMIQLAKQYNRFGDRCTYHLNSAPDLSLFGDNSFDFVVTVQVLQHMRPEYSTVYIREFFRVLKPGGVVVFQVPCGLVSGPSLPDLDCKLQIMPRQLSLTAQHARLIWVEATIRNVGDVAWPPSTWPKCTYPVLLGHQWLDASGQFLADGEDMAALPDRLEPLDEAHLQIAVKSPKKPGNYILVFDLVQPGVGWSKNMGTERGKVLVQIEGNVEAKDHIMSDMDSNAQGPRIEMYVVPKPQILKVVADAGGKTIMMQDHTDEAWISPYYVATKT
jgi:ubiquinone/menaquinone biosynthesis C-methylase UbiE